MLIVVDTTCVPGPEISKPPWYGSSYDSPRDGGCDWFHGRGPRARFAACATGELKTMTQECSPTQVEQLFHPWKDELCKTSTAWWGFDTGAYP